MTQQSKLQGPVWREQLRRAGLRVTPQRLATLEALAMLEAPISHEGLAQQIDQPMDRATVYRNLVALCRAQLVRREHGGDRIWRYSLAAQQRAHRAAHPHFSCSGCGDTRCLQASDVRLAGAAQALGAQSDQVEVWLRGQCDRCALPL
jgi:Fe2+ or Zn2+ uptake regulation protein